MISLLPLSAEKYYCRLQRALPGPSGYVLADLHFNSVYIGFLYRRKPKNTDMR